MEEQKIGYIDIFKQKEYMKTVFAGVINRFGDSIDSIAFVWLVYQVTQSAAWSAIIFGVNRIPTVFLMPLAGAAIERKSKKHIMVITDIVRGICVGFVATALITGFLNQWILLVSTFIISCAEAFRLPASTALIPKLLDKKHYEFGMPLNTSACSAAELIGLGAAGIIIAVFSVSTAIYIDMATFFVSAIIIFTLKVKEENGIKDKIKVKEYTDTLKEGFSYLIGKPVLRYFAIVFVLSNIILVPYNSLLAPLVSEVLKANEIMLSVLGITLTIGIIVGASVYPYVRNKLSIRALASVGSYSFGAFYFIAVLVGKCIDSAIIMYLIISVVSFASGLAMSLGNSFFNVEIIKHTEEKYLTRVSAIMGAASMAAIPVTSFIVSALAEIVSIAVLFIITGGLSVIICMCLFNKKRFRAMVGTNMEVIQEYKMEGVKMQTNLELMQHVNMLNEAYTLLNYWANFDNLEKIREEYADNYLEDQENYKRKIDLIMEMYNYVKANLKVSKERIEYYFKERNTNMSNYGALAALRDQLEYEKELQPYEERFKNITEEERIRKYAAIIDFEEAENTPDGELKTSADLIDFIEASPYVKEAKWEAIKIFNNQEKYYNEIYDILAEVTELLNNKYKSQFEEMGQEFYEYWNEYQKDNNLLDAVEEKVKISWRHSLKGTVIMPLIFGPFSVTISYDGVENRSRDVIQISIILDKNFNLGSKKAEKEDVINLGKLLCDKSKVDILEYLSTNTAYGKEIADKLNLSTATVSYHVNALLRNGFLKADINTNKVYYCIDRARILSYLDNVRKYFTEQYI